MCHIYYFLGIPLILGLARQLSGEGTYWHTWCPEFKRVEKKATQRKDRTTLASSSPNKGVLSFSSELKVKMLVHLVIILNFLRKSRLLFKSSIVFRIPIMCKCPSLHIAKQYLLLLLPAALCWGPRVNSLWVCFCSSLVTTDAENHFICWQSVCTSSVEKYLFRSFAYFSFL